MSIEIPGEPALLHRGLNDPRPSHLGTSPPQARVMFLDIQSAIQIS